MNMKKLLAKTFILVFFLLSVLLFSRDKPVNHTKKPEQPTQETGKTTDSPSNFGTDILKVLIGIILGGGILKYIQYLRRNKDARQKKEAELDAEKKFKEKEKLTAAKTAEEIIAEATAEPVPIIQKIRKKEPLLQYSFRNPLEYNVEYIKIPGGTYEFSVSKQIVTVPDLYFCKYPVTNKRYRCFISFLAGKEKELEKELSLDLFTERLLKFAQTIKGYLGNIMGKYSGKWQSEFRSSRNNDKKFNGDDQPVVDVTWYAARAYCFWLSCLDATIRGGNQLLNGDITQLASIYRLPREEEWEWAAGGETDGSIRKYPWPKEKGEPDKNLANYGRVVLTTPVDRYPEGATPSGLMDMAGNVWEWMENYYDKEEDLMALRGGSWYDEKEFLCCSARRSLRPSLLLSGVLGFRVLRASLPQPGKPKKRACLEIPKSKFQIPNKVEPFGRILNAFDQRYKAMALEILPNKIRLR